MRVSTSLRVDNDAKEIAAQVFKQYGMSISDGVNLFLHQVALTHSIPFDLKVPNETMKQALDELKNKKGKSFYSLEDLRKDLMA